MLPEALRFIFSNLIFQSIIWRKFSLSSFPELCINESVIEISVNCAAISPWQRRASCFLKSISSTPGVQALHNSEAGVLGAAHNFGNPRGLCQLPISLLSPRLLSTGAFSFCQGEKALFPYHVFRFSLPLWFTLIVLFQHCSITIPCITSALLKSKNWFYQETEDVVCLALRKLKSWREEKQEKTIIVFCGECGWVRRFCD